MNSVRFTAAQRAQALEDIAEGLAMLRRMRARKGLHAVHKRWLDNELGSLDRARHFLESQAER